MRCKACDTILNDYELTRKDSEGRHYDLCGTCYKFVRDIETENNNVDVDSVLRYNDDTDYTKEIL
jgi:hypothetical protein